MSNNQQIDWQEIIKLGKRMRSGYKAFCAYLDLLGMQKTMKLDPDEAIHRLDDFQQGFGDALLLFPGGEDYRVCFLADSLLVIKEITPEENNEDSWPFFCGHVFALASCVQELEKNIGNPGLRMFVSYGQLYQIVEPNSWHQYPISEFTKTWFVLTGASEALKKCDRADRIGQRGGFEGGYCWHEDPNEEGSYLGTPIYRINPTQMRQPNLYPFFYKELCEKSDKTVRLPN